MTRIHLGVLIALAQSAHAQAVYRPTTDTLAYTSLNSYVMYVVRDGDTLGRPVETRTTEYYRLAGDPRGIRLWARLEFPGAHGGEQEYLLTASGRVLELGGRPVGQVAQPRVDLLPRLPPERLAAGLTWLDTVSVAGRDSYGDTYYRVRRNYRVARMLDSLGTEVAVLVAAGEMALKQGGWQDSAAGRAWWQEVAGPVADTVWFDTRRGQILASVGVMDLRGSYGAGTARLPSGLRSLVRRTRQR